MNQQLLDRVTTQAAAWITDGYVGELRCIQQLRDGELFVHDATLTFAPTWVSHLLNPQNDLHLETGTLVADQHSAKGIDRDQLIGAINSFTCGRIELNGVTATLRQVDRAADFYSEVTFRDRWNFPLHLQVQVQGDTLAPLSPLAVATLDDALRQASPPFDGLSDLGKWLSLNGALDGTRASSITLNVLPPVELLFTESKLENEQLIISLRSTTGADLKEIRVAVLIVPSTVAEGRLQLAEQVRWGQDKAHIGHRKGTLTVQVGSAVSVQVLLSYKGYSVTRQWFTDTSRSRSTRHLSMIQFDPEPKGLRAALFTNGDARDFEKAVGCVAYLVGLASALPLQSRTPDLVATTPKGHQLVIECTLATADFSTKIGKLVDRCNALKKSLAANSLASAEVIAVLVCRQPSDQIARDDSELRRHRILLVTGELLEQALMGAWGTLDPDAIVDKATAAWTGQQSLD